MLLAILALYFYHGTFDIIELAQVESLFDGVDWIATLAFWAFFIAFAIKVPLFPFHTWLPDAHTAAPTAGSVILAGVLLKLGGYGMMRIALPIFPEQFKFYCWNVPIIPILALISIIYGALVCMAQWDLKRLIAYSSVSHMGYFMLGVAAAAAAYGRAGLRRCGGHGRQRRGAADVQPRHHHRRPVLPGRRDLRAGPHPRPESLWWAGQGDALLLWHLYGHRLGQPGAARPGRLLGRVLCLPGRL